MTKKHFPLPALSFCIASHAAPQTLQTFYRSQLFSYFKQKMPFLVSKCKVGRSMAILFVPNHKNAGIYAEFSATGIQENGADIIFSGSIARLGDLMIGGLAITADYLFSCPDMAGHFL